jgi:hypothetical protein
VRVIVRLAAMSAATMMACAADKIVMGKHSYLGPIDPQLRLQTPLGVQQIPAHTILLRGERVMLDADLAALYEVETRSLLQAVKRNAARFPPDFMFQLTDDEAAILRSQTGISSAGHGGRRYPPYAFTEHGVAMLSAVLRSDRAVQVSIEIVRAFFRLRAMLAGNADLARKLAALERKYDAQFKVVFDAIRDLMAPSSKARRPIGFRP